MLLRHKWSSFGSFVYYSNLFQFLLYLIFLTGYIVVTKPKHFWRNTTAYDTLDDYIRYQKGSGVNWNSFIIFHNIGQWIIIAFCIFNLLKEVRLFYCSSLIGRVSMNWSQTAYFADVPNESVQAELLDLRSEYDRSGLLLSHPPARCSHCIWNE